MGVRVALRRRGLIRFLALLQLLLFNFCILAKRPHSGFF